MNEIGIEKVRHLLAKSNLEAVLVHSNVNKKYFGALSGSGVYLLISHDHAWLILDGRYEGEVKKQPLASKSRLFPKVAI